MYSYSLLALASVAAAAVMPGSPQHFANGIMRRNETVTTTKVVSAYTTYCPEPTTFELGGKTYEVEEPTTITITDCPCTIVEPCYTCGPNVPTGTPTPPGPNPPKPNPPGPPAPPAATTAPPTQPEQPTQPPLVGAAGQNGVALVGAAVFGLLAL